MGVEECFSPQIGPSESRLHAHTRSRRSANDLANGRFVAVVRVRGLAAGGEGVELNKVVSASVQFGLG